MKVYGIWNTERKHWAATQEFFTKKAAMQYIVAELNGQFATYDAVPWPTDDDDKPDDGTPVPHEILWHIGKGKTINILNRGTWPEPEEMIRVIAWGLAGELRFGAQPVVPYTVAQHSVAVCELMQAERSNINAVADKIALLHDGHEALGLRDLASPVKEHLPGYKELAQMVQQQIWDHFGIRGHHVWQFQDQLKASDDKACAQEQEIIWDARNMAQAWNRSDSYRAFLESWEACR